MRTKLRWIAAARNGGSPPSAAASGQLIAAGTTVSIYGFRCLGGTGIADFFGGTDATGVLLSTCVAGADSSDRDLLDDAGGIIETSLGVYVRVYGDPYDAAILVDASAVPA